MSDERKLKRNHLISRKKFRSFIAEHPNADRDLDSMIDWCKIVEKADWRNFADVRETFPHADLIGDLVCFNLCGNKYRVLVGIDYRADLPAWVYIERVYTHREYDKWWKGK